MDTANTNKIEYHIGALVFPSVEETGEAVIVDRLVALAYSVQNDAPTVHIIIHTPDVATLHDISANMSFVSINPINDLSVVESGILESFHIWASAENEQELRAVEVFKKRLAKAGVYTVVVLL